MTESPSYVMDSFLQGITVPAYFPYYQVTMEFDDGLGDGGYSTLWCVLIVTNSSGENPANVPPATVEAVLAAMSTAARTVSGCNSVTFAPVGENTVG